MICVSALVLAGCGGGNTSDNSADKATTAKKTSAAPTAPSVKPADGITLRTSDFSYRVPRGWKDIGELLPSAVSVAGDATDTSDGFTDNINVMRIEPAPVTDPGELENASIRELKGIQAKDLLVLDRQEVDGSTAIHVLAGVSQRGTDYTVEQFNIIHEGVAYVVTFSFSPDVTKDARTELSQSVLTTWKWAA